MEGILAIDNQNGLSKNGVIPWHNKKDIEFFVEKTINNVVVMGINTLLSFPNSKPLRKRVNIVITNNAEKYNEIYGSKYSSDILRFVDMISLDNALKDYTNKKIFVIGGNQIYNILLPYCSLIWVSKIKNAYDCDLKLDFDLSSYTKTIIYDDNELEISMCAI